MPVTPKHPCAERGCPRLVPQGAPRCALHASAPFGRRRSPKRLYGAEHRSLREQTLERDGFQCVGCGSRRDLQRDHVERLGPESLANSQTLCRRCNLRKAQREAAASRGGGSRSLASEVGRDRRPSRNRVRAGSEVFSPRGEG